MATFEISSPPPVPFDTIQQVLDFAPGAWTPSHWHPIPGYIQILQGTLAHRVEGTPDVHRAGTGLIELPQLLHDGGNAGEITLRLMATWLLPKGESVTHLVT